MVDNIILSFKGIFSHKMRSFLTMLGIIIGISSIIAIVSTIKGTNEQIQKNLIGSGTNNVNVRISQGDYEYDFSMGNLSNFKLLSETDRESLSMINNVNDVSFYRRRQDYEGITRLDNSVTGGYVVGIDSHYLNTTETIILKGRGFSANDYIKMNRVCLLDQNSAQQLFLGVEPVGNTIEIKGTPFIVVGVIDKKKSFEPTIKTIDDYYIYHKETSGTVYIPESAWPMVYQYDEPQNVLLKTHDTKAMTKIGKEAEKLLNGLNNSNEEISYKAEDLLKQAQQLQQLSNSTNTMLIWIAGISLLVGGIGVMNIMLVSVTERTKEIGLKKAIGAHKRIILSQFLTEAVVLTSIGGILGVIFGIVLAYLISGINGTPVAISVEAAIFAVLFSMIIGIVFGMLPSYKAANLDPIEALRHE